MTDLSKLPERRVYEALVASRRALERAEKRYREATAEWSRRIAKP